MAEAGAGGYDKTVRGVRLKLALAPVQPASRTRFASWQAGKRPAANARAGSSSCDASRTTTAASSSSDVSVSSSSTSSSDVAVSPSSGGSSVYTDDGSVMPTDEMAAEFAEFDKEAALSKVARDAAQARAASIVSRACATRELFAFLGEQQADEEVERGAAEQQADEEVERGAASCRADSCRLLLTHAFRPRAARVCRRRPRLRAWQKRALAGMTKRCVAFA